MYPVQRVSWKTEPRKLSGSLNSTIGE
jgi:hypothetical protein